MLLDWSIYPKEMHASLRQHPLLSMYLSPYFLPWRDNVYQYLEFEHVTLAPFVEKKKKRMHQNSKNCPFLM